MRDHLPGKAGDSGRTTADSRLFLNAVIYVLNTGIPWADLPERFGKPNTVWKRYDRWCESGAWERIGRALGEAGVLKGEDGGDEPAEEVQLDSTSVKDHPTASTGRRRAREENKTPTHAAASVAPAAPGRG